MKTVVVTIAAAISLTPGVSAADKGRFSAHCVLVSTKFSEIKAQEGHPMRGVMAGEMDGLAFQDGGSSRLDKLLDKAHYHVAWVGDGGGGGYCLKTFTTGDGNKLFARCEATGNPKGFSGTVHLLGGTGPFAGIKGKGRFSLTYVTPTVSRDEIEWDWETP